LTGDTLPPPFPTNSAKYSSAGWLFQPVHRTCRCGSRASATTTRAVPETPLLKRNQRRAPLRGRQAERRCTGLTRSTRAHTPLAGGTITLGAGPR
jgi:hypothetical protein